MTCHNLKIDNYKNNDAVEYSIIKIRGSVEINSMLCENSEKTVFLNCDTTQLTATLCNNTFKFLLELQSGQNTINIRFCCDTISFVIERISDVRKNAVIPLYVICEGHDGCFQAPFYENNTPESACNRISLGLKLLQCITAEKLLEHTLKRRTFKIENNCQIFRSEISFLEARKMSQIELWEHIGKDIMKTYKETENKKYLAFLSCTRYCGEKYSNCLQNHEDLLQITQGYVALGGGALALFGSACLYTWPENFEEVVSRFENNTAVDRKQFLDDSCYRGTLGACFSTTLGSVLHELYHTFDLGHTAKGIMGRGFDNIFKFFTNCNLSQNNRSRLNSFRDTIEFKEKLTTSTSLERFLVDSRKDYTVTKKIDEVDDTVLTKSCAALLYFHRWFNKSSIHSSNVSFDVVNGLIRSTSGIRVVEIRTPCDELVIYNWVFLGRVLKFSFQITEDVVSEIYNKIHLLVVEDSLGCIFKERFIFSN